MSYGKVFFAILLVCIVFIPLAFSQEATMLLNHKEIGSHERPGVQFNHDQHSSKIECIQCHHDFDQYGNNLGGEDKAQPCAGCHTKAAGKNVLPLSEAFHGQCKNCHEYMQAAGRPSGPIMCGECHVKK